MTLSRGEEAQPHYRTKKEIKQCFKRYLFYGRDKRKQKYIEIEVRFKQVSLRPENSKQSDVLIQLQILATFVH